MDPFENSCGHRFCRKCIKAYLLDCWRRNREMIQCPGLGCPAAIGFQTQKEFLSQEIAKEMVVTVTTNKLLSAFKQYCGRTFSSKLNPWIWISSCCGESIDLPLPWVIRSWCPSIPIEVSEEVLKCTKCETIWYGLVRYSINLYNLFLIFFFVFSFLVLLV